MEVSTYWEGDSTPILEICRKSWEEYLPDGCTVIDYAKDTSFHKKTDFVYPGNWNTLTVQHKSDVMRLNCIVNHGGLWLDATTELFKSAEWILDHPCRGEAYLMPRANPFAKYPESWFIYAPKPQTASLKLWLLELVDALEKLPSNKYEDLSSKATLRSEPGSTYFLIYDSYLYLEKMHPNVFVPPDSLRFGLIRDTWFLCLLPVRQFARWGLDMRPLLKYTGHARQNVKTRRTDFFAFTFLVVTIFVSLLCTRFIGY